MSIHDPIQRKRSLPNSNHNALKKMKSTVNLPTAAASIITTPEEFSEKMYSAYVKSALDSLDKSDSTPINALSAQIALPLAHSDSISLPHFNVVLGGLMSNVGKLDDVICRGLVTSVLEFKWMEVNKDKVESEETYLRFIELYSRFLSLLVSSFPKYLQEVTKKLVGEFKYLDCSKSTPLNHHEILSKIVRFIPTCVNTFSNNIQSFFPHHLSSNTAEITNYINNLLKMVTYCPDLQFSVWQFIIESCIKLDVELQNELDDLDDDEIDEVINGEASDDEDDKMEEGDKDETHGAEGKQESSTMDVTDSTVAAYQSDDEMTGETEYLMEVTSTTHIKKLSSKLDSIMHSLLTSTSGSFTIDELNTGNGVSLFNTITSLFRTHILPTHFTKSIQFVLFHISQFQPELSDSYLVLIIDVAFNNNEILEKRLKALQYLSSYIARAKTLSKHQIVFVVSYLVGWLDKYILERECEVYSNNSAVSVGGMERFKLFYAAFQALLYIFCFRYKSLYVERTSDSDSEWECDLDKFFQRVILVKFNPLKYCDETVIYIFAKLATKLNVCYCYSIIEHNKRERMLQTSGSALPSAIGNFKHKQEFLDFEAYFPFDPIVLPTCKGIITENYVEWSDVNPSNEDEDDEDSGSHPEGDDDIVSSDEEITSDEED